MSVSLESTLTGPWGPDGEDDGTRIASAVAEFDPVAVIIDLTELEYRWGDAIGQIDWVMRRPDETFIPACVVARDKTAESIAPLFGPNWILGFAGVRLVDTVEAACRDLLVRCTSA